MQSTCSFLTQYNKLIINIGTHNTRFALNKCLSKPKPRNANLKKISYSGVLWNSIYPHIRNCTTLDSFKLFKPVYY